MVPNNERHDMVRLEDGKALLSLLQDVFTDAFMHRFTRFDNFEQFCFSSAVIVNWNAETLIYSQRLLDHFVQESTDFADWDTMVRRATQLRFHPEA